LKQHWRQQQQQLLQAMVRFQRSATLQQRRRQVVHPLLLGLRLAAVKASHW
jgi:hypothetical protein